MSIITATPCLLRDTHHDKSKFTIGISVNVVSVALMLGGLLSLTCTTGFSVRYATPGTFNIINLHGQVLYLGINIGR